MTSSFPFMDGQEEQIFLSYLHNFRLDDSTTGNFTFITSEQYKVVVKAKFLAFKDDSVCCIIERDSEKSQLLKKLQYYEMYDSCRSQMWAFIEVISSSFSSLTKYSSMMQKSMMDIVI